MISGVGDTHLSVPLVHNPRDLDLLPPHRQKPVSLTADEEFEFDSRRTEETIFNT